MNEQEETVAQNEQNTQNDISLRVISIPDKEWKDYRNQASQGELLALGIGSKMWLNRTRKKTLVFSLLLLLTLAAGALLAVFVEPIIGIPIAVLGYLVFCTLCVRRHFVKTSLNQIKSKLNADNKKALDAEFKASGGATFAEVIITLILCSIGEPYYMVLAILTAVIPSVLNTKLVIPEGYGFEQLEEVKGFYAEKSFLSDVVDMCVDYNHNDAMRSRGNGQATFRDEHGNEVDVEEQSYTNARGEKVYKDDNGREYVSDDGGVTVRRDTEGHGTFYGKREDDE